MTNNFTAEEVRTQARYVEEFDHRTAVPAMLTAYAALLEHREAGVTDDVVQKALDIFVGGNQYTSEHQCQRMRAALQSVWPVTTGKGSPIGKVVKGIHSGCYIEFSNGADMLDYTGCELFTRPIAAEPMKREVHMNRMIGTPTYPNAAADPFNKLMSQPDDSGRVVDWQEKVNDIANNIGESLNAGCDQDAVDRINVYVDELFALAAQGHGESVKRWPFVESPGEFAARLQAAMGGCSLLGAVRNVLIENPPTLVQPAPPASPAGVPDGWISDPDTIPKTLIDACRDAICREFGNNGTDGYYKRILAKVFAALAAAPSAPEGDGGAE